MMGTFQCRAVLGVALAVFLLLISLPEGAADGESPCGQTLNSTTGQISLPADTVKGMCIIKVQRAADAGFTTFQFTSVNMKGNDSMTIYDGAEAKPEDLITKIAAGTVKGPFTVVAKAAMSSIYINVTVDHTTSIVEATYDNTECTINQTVACGMYIQSPLYKTGAEFTCSYAYNLADKSSSTLALSFLQVSMAKATLTITSPAGQGPVTGNTIPADLYTQDPLTMELSVKGDQTAKFLASLSAVTSGDCGKTVTVENSKDLQLNVPEFHLPSYDCRVTLQAKSGKSLMLNVTSLQLVSGGDRLTVVDGPSLTAGYSLASLTKATPGYMVLSSKDHMVVRLVVDEMTGKRSFSAKVTELATVNRFNSPGNFTIAPPSDAASFPLTQYYLMAAADGNMVVFNLEDNDPKKTYHYTIDVRDGCQINSPLLISFSSEQTERIQVASTGTKLLVVATWTNTSDPLESSFNFTDSTGCDQMTSASSGSFKLMTSSTSPAPAKCTWTITNRSGTTMLTFPGLSLSQKASVTVSSGGSPVAILTAVNTFSGSPSITMPVSSSWPQIVFSTGGSVNLTTVEVEVMFRVGESMCGQEISDEHGYLQSPLFPNLYPLNSQCKWTFPDNVTGRLLFFNFNELQLVQNHNLTFVERFNSSVQKVVATYGGMKPLASLLYASNLVNDVTFSAPPKSLQAIDVKRGFDVEYWVLKCGGNITGSSKTISSPGYPAPVKTKNLCVWIITVPATNSSSKGSVNIIKMNFVLKTTGSVQKNALSVYDGNSLTAPPLTYSTKAGNATYSLYNTVIVVFNTSSLAKPVDSVAFQVKYTTYMCNSSNLCDNGLCIHPGWRCNQVDDCGDNTDERNCVLPIPSPQSKEGGVKPYVVALLFFIGLLLGIIATVCLPRVIRRFRSNRYTAFQNEPALA